jgi:hypothetical protein
MGKEIIPIQKIAPAIFVLRGQKVILSQDLAALYGVTVGAPTQAIMRAFVKLRETLETNRELARKFAELERRVGERTRLACPFRRLAGKRLLDRMLRAEVVQRRGSSRWRRRHRQHARRLCSPIRNQ